MPTNKPQTKTFVIPDQADRFPSSTPPGLPPDGYVITFSATDGYYIAKPSTRLLILSFPGAGASPYSVVNEDVVEVPSHSGTYQVALPISPLPGTQVYIKDAGGVANTNPINITTTQLVDTQNPYQITNNFGCIKVVFTGTTWSVISKV